MGSATRAALGLLAACCALGAVAGCSDLLGIKDFTGGGVDSGTPPPSDGSSSSGGEASGGTPTIGFGGFASATDVDGGVQILSPTLGFEQGPGDLLVLLINYDPLLTITQIGDASGKA